MNTNETTTTAAAGGGEDDGITMYVVVSAIDDCAYGPFLTRNTALEFAEDCDGSTFAIRADDAI